MRRYFGMLCIQFILSYHNLYVYGIDFSNSLPPNPVEAVVEGSIVFGMVLENSVITRLTDLSFHDCLTECIKRPRCKSVNYLQTFQQCELNYDGEKGSELQSSNGGAVFAVIKPWIYEKNKCRPGISGIGTLNMLNRKCVDDESGAATSYLSDCGLPQSIPNNTLDVSNGIGVHSKAVYTCPDGFLTNGKSQISCQPNGVWSSADFQCIRVCGAGMEPIDDSCKNCTSGTYSDTLDASTCKICPDHHYQDKVGQRSCKSCSATDNPCGNLSHTQATFQTDLSKRFCMATYSCTSGRDHLLNTTLLYLKCHSNISNEPRLNCINSTHAYSHRWMQGCPTISYIEHISQIEHVLQVFGYFVSFMYTMSGKRQFCDISYDGGNWMIIQQRTRALQETYFNKTWQDYKLGFSSSEGDFWIGNTILHELTQTATYELAILMWRPSGQGIRQKSARYRNFSVGNEDSKFEISINQYQSDVSDLWDSISYLQIDGQPFSTWNNDSSPANCSVITGTGWWFTKNARSQNDSCYYGDVNALSWYHPGYYYRTRMMIRSIP